MVRKRPGRSNEHTDAHVVAAWDGEAVAHQPGVRAAGRSDTRGLAKALNERWRRAA